MKWALPPPPSPTPEPVPEQDVTPQKVEVEEPKQLGIASKTKREICRDTNTTVTAWVTKEQRDKLKAAAEQRGMKLSEFVRILLTF